MWGTCPGITIKRSSEAFVRSAFEHVSKRVETRRGHKRLNNGYIMRSFLDVFREI